MARKSRSLEDCLKSDAGFARFAPQAARLLNLQRLLDSATPLARNARVANLRMGKVIIHATNSATAAKLRQITPTIVSAFRHEAPEVTGIDIRVQPRAGDRQPVSLSPPRAIGETQKRGLTSLADLLPEGSPLKSALERLVVRSR